MSTLKPVVTSRDDSVITKQTESQIDYEVYHFKVMELKTIEDGMELNECRCLFEFDFKLI